MLKRIFLSMFLVGVIGVNFSAYAEDICSVDYNSNQNSIVACSNRDSSNYERSVTITVIKYLDSGCFESFASATRNINGFFLFEYAVVNPSMVKKLKKKIAKFETNFEANKQKKKDLFERVKYLIKIDEKE